MKWVLSLILKRDEQGHKTYRTNKKQSEDLNSGNISLELILLTIPSLGLPSWLSGKESTCSAGDMVDSILG